MKTKSTHAPAFARIDAIIAQHGPRLANFPGVVEVWSGFKFRNGRLTKQPAIIISVLKKQPVSKLKKAELLPKKLDGVPVDVVPASAAQLIRFALLHGEALTGRSAPELPGMVAADAFVAHRGTKCFVRGATVGIDLVDAIECRGLKPADLFQGGGTFILQQDLGVFQSAITKQTVTGDRFTIRHNVDYDSNNAPVNLFTSNRTSRSRC